MSKKITSNNQTQDPRFKDVRNSWDNLDEPSKEILYKAVSGDHPRKKNSNQWRIVISYALNPNNKKNVAGLFIVSLFTAPFTINLTEHNYLFFFSILFILNVICLGLLNLLNATDQIRSELIYSALGLAIIVALTELTVGFITKAPPFLMVLVKTISLNIVLILFAMLFTYIIVQLKKIKLT